MSGKPPALWSSALGRRLWLAPLQIHPQQVRQHALVDLSSAINGDYSICCP
jgi:hypothetical protein